MPLKLNDTGAEVIKLQTLLIATGADLEASGLFDKKTEAAVAYYQLNNGLVADGVVGPKTLASLQKDKQVPPSKVSSEMYPDFAVVMKQRMTTRGKYAKGYPLGAVVHFTAGRDGAEKTILNAINAPPNEQYTYWCIQKDGTLYCAHPVNEWGWHAGQGRWEKWIPWLKGSLNDELIGIEMNNAGRLTKKDTKYYSWFNTEIPAENVRYCDGSSPDQCEGYYEKYTPAQEETLFKTLMWLKAQNPGVFTFDAVLGHCEISGKMGIGKWVKNDPSAALSMTMPQLRDKLKIEWLKNNK